MAKPDLEDGYLRIAHELFAALACGGFTKWEWVVIREVLDQVYGIQKRKTAIISPTGIASQVSTHKQSIVRATSSLIACNVLVKVGEMEYRFIKDYEIWTDGKQPRLSQFEGRYCAYAKPALASTKPGNNGAYASTKPGNNGAYASTKPGNNGAYDGKRRRFPGEAPALPPAVIPPDPPLEPARTEKEKCENGRHTHTILEITTGRAGEEHRLFVQVFDELNAYEPTRFLAASLVMAADTPGIRGLPSWRLLVAARTVQRPDKDKSWPLFQHIAETCTEAQYQKLLRKPAPTAAPTVSASESMQNFNPPSKSVEKPPTEEQIDEAMKAARADRGKRINLGLTGLKHWVAVGYLAPEVLREFERS